LALFREVEQQEENQDVLGSSVPKEIPTGRVDEAEAEPAQGSAKDSKHLSKTISENQEVSNDAEGEDKDSKEGEDEQDEEEREDPTPASGGQDNADGEIEDDPLQLAWESLEAARAIFEKDEDKELRLADTLLLLGDVNLRNEMFDNAVLDYERCLELRTHKLKPDDRLIMEVCPTLVSCIEKDAESFYQVLHQIAIAKLNYTDPKMAETHRDAAVKALRKAIEVCELRIENLKKILKNDCEVGDLETSIVPKSRGDVEEEINELEAIMVFNSCTHTLNFHDNFFDRMIWKNELSLKRLSGTLLRDRALERIKPWPWAEQVCRRSWNRLDLEFLAPRPVLALPQSPKPLEP
jgi:tetratricopeptide (TPR) repeat protein